MHDEQVVRVESAVQLRPGASDAPRNARDGSGIADHVSGIEEVVGLLHWAAMATNDERGARGPQGIPGPPGPPGPAGPRGLSGLKGQRGLTGKTGQQGHRGPRGLSGKRGALGKTGKAGKQGTRGAVGKEPTWRKKLLGDVQVQINRIDRELEIQLKRIAQIQFELDQLRTNVKRLEGSN